MKHVFAVAALMAVTSVPASAALITPSVADLHTLSFSADNIGNVFSVSQNLLLDGVNLIANSRDGGAMDLEFDSALLSIPNLAGDIFQVSYFNSNDNPWTYTVSIFDAGGLIGSDSTSVGALQSDTLNIAGLTGAAITRINVRVTGGPFNPLDSSTNSTLTVPSVPEPASLLLFGAGLFVAGTTLRRRR